MAALSSPAPGEIRAAREVAGLSQTAASELVHSGLRTWQQWEAGDRRMHPGLWELYLIKTGVRSMTDKNPYLAGLELVKIHHGTSGQAALAKCILSLYNSRTPRTAQ